MKILIKRRIISSTAWLQELSQRNNSVKPRALRLMSSKLHALLPFLIAVISITCIPTAYALTDDGDDFSNNLFSDLSPILALFGEQVAKQFMAGSLGWSDNVLFAMVSSRVVLPICQFLSHVYVT